MGRVRKSLPATYLASDAEVAMAFSGSVQVRFSDKLWLEMNSAEKKERIH